MRSSTRFRLGPRKKQGAMQYYQNLWNMPQIYKKQQRWFKYKYKTYSNELKRPVYKYIMHKNICPYWVSNKTKTTGIPKRGLLSSIPTGKATTSGGGCFSFAAPLCGKTSSTGSFANGSFPLLLQQTNVHVVAPRIHFKKALCLIQKRYWFFDNAAPIPGVSFLKKRKMLQKKEMMAFKNIQNWLGIYSKKQMKTIFNQKISKNWYTLLIIESMLQSSIRKGFLTINAQDSNTLALCKQTTLNGKFIHKLRSVNVDADLFEFTNSKAALKKVQNFYRVGRLFVGFQIFK